jgi:hypothetical protein
MATYTSIINENDAPFLAGYAFDKNNPATPGLAKSNLDKYNAILKANDAKYQYVDANIDANPGVQGLGLGFYAATLERININTGEVTAIIPVFQQTRVSTIKQNPIGTAEDSFADALNIIGLPNPYSSADVVYATNIFKTFGDQGIPISAVGQSGGAIGAQLFVAAYTQLAGQQSPNMLNSVTLAGPGTDLIVKNVTGFSATSLSGINFDYSNDIVTCPNTGTALPFGSKNDFGVQVTLPNYSGSTIYNGVDVGPNIYSHFIPAYNGVDLHSLVPFQSDLPPPSPSGFPLATATENGSVATVSLASNLDASFVTLLAYSDFFTNPETNSGIASSVAQFALSIPANLGTQST